MDRIKIEQPTEVRLRELGVSDWPVWAKDVSVFPWAYGEQETCYILEGEVVVTPDDGEPVRIRKGDLVTFPAGMSCRWQVQVPIRKHYRMG